MSARHEMRTSSSVLLQFSVESRKADTTSTPLAKDARAVSLAEPERILEDLKKLPSQPSAIAGGPNVIELIIKAQGRDELKWPKPVVLLSGGWKLRDDLIAQDAAV